MLKLLAVEHPSSYFSSGTLNVVICEMGTILVFTSQIHYKDKRRPPMDAFNKLSHTEETRNKCIDMKTKKRFTSPPSGTNPDVLGSFLPDIFFCTDLKS